MGSIVEKHYSIEDPHRNVGVFCSFIFLSYIWFVIQREMTSEKLADEILARYEDDREYHFHQVDREWIIEAMIEFANEMNTKEK